MNLFFQLLPFVLLAAISGIAVVLYVVQQSKTRRGQRPAKASAEPKSSHPAFEIKPVPFALATPKQRPSGNGPVLRLYDMEMSPHQIAAALERPLQEVEIILKFEEAKRRRRAAS